MIVYRLEDSKGYGPWATDFRGAYGDYMYYTVCPFFTVEYGFYSHFKDVRFGCVSIEQMKSTLIFDKRYTDSYIKEFDKKGFRIVEYDVPKTRMIADETQCVFDWAYAVKVSEIDFRVLFGKEISYV